MLFRLILLVTAGVLLIGGAFLWINHINDETKMAEELNSVLPPKRIAKKTSGRRNQQFHNDRNCDYDYIQFVQRIYQRSCKLCKVCHGSSAIGINIAKLQNSIKDIPNQFMPTTTDPKKSSQSNSHPLGLHLILQSPSAFPAITREQASPLARVSAGKSDPLSPIIGFKQFPAFFSN